MTSRRKSGGGSGQVLAGACADLDGGDRRRPLVGLAPLVALVGADRFRVEPHAIALAHRSAEELALDGRLAVRDQDRLQLVLVGLELDPLGLEAAEPIDDFADGLGGRRGEIEVGGEFEGGQLLDELPRLAGIAANLTASLVRADVPRDAGDARSLGINASLTEAS